MLHFDLVQEEINLEPRLKWSFTSEQINLYLTMTFSDIITQPQLAGVQNYT